MSARQHIQTARQRESGPSPWQEYIRRREAWMVANPGATPEDYQIACRRIAADLGL